MPRYKAAIYLSCKVSQVKNGAERNIGAHKCQEYENFAISKTKSSIFESGLQEGFILLIQQNLPISNIVETIEGKKDFLASAA